MLDQSCYKKADEIIEHYEKYTKAHKKPDSAGCTENTSAKSGFL